MSPPTSSRKGFFADKPSEVAAEWLATGITRRRLLVFGGSLAAVAAFIRRDGLDENAASVSTTVQPHQRNPATPAGPDRERALPQDQRQSYELVISGGRVIDPETGFDATANIGIDGSTIATITTEPLSGRRTIEADGLVVSPGFVDLLSYEPNPVGADRKVFDGVTTNLAMHGISVDPGRFFHPDIRLPLHWGGAFHQHVVRGRLWERTDRPLPADERQQLAAAAEAALEAGLAGISFSLEYSPGTDQTELETLAAVAAERDQVCFFHLRHSGVDDLALARRGVTEAINVAARFGVAVHLEHLPSTGGTGQMDTVLDLVEDARSDSLDVTACFYPYDYWGTFLASARFSAGWQKRFNLTYEDLQIAGTSERLSAASVAAARETNQLVIAHGSIPAADVRHACQRPWTIVASDAIVTPGSNNHPRAAGTFCRMLGVYVRDLEVLNLVDALAKMTILPAKRVEKMLPAMKKKGRLQAGCDADITLFSPEQIKDQATVVAPSLPSVGVEYVVVGGELVVDSGQRVPEANPGQALRSAGA